MDKRNLGIVRQYFASVVWSHKIHVKCHEILRDRNREIKICNISLITLILFSLFLQLTFPKVSICISFFSWVLTILETVVLIYTLSFNFWELANLHKTCADDLKSIRDEFLALIWDIMNEWKVDIELLRDDIKGRLCIINKYLPEQVKGAYEQARDSLWVDPATQNGDYTYTDEEIDRFLPKELKIWKQ